MGALLEQIAEWLKGMLVDGIMNNLSGMFDAVNRQVADVATQVGSTPASFSPGVFALVRNISESVIIPIAGMFLTFIACYELIQLIIEHNNLANFNTSINHARRLSLADISYSVQSGIQFISTFIKTAVRHHISPRCSILHRHNTKK